MQSVAWPNDPECFTSAANCNHQSWKCHLDSSEKPFPVFCSKLGRQRPAASQQGKGKSVTAMFTRNGLIPSARFSTDEETNSSDNFRVAHHSA